MAETPSFIEGEEEVQYIFVSLPNDVDPVAFGPGSVVKIEGLATEQPVLRPVLVPAAAAAAAQAAGEGGNEGKNAAVALDGTYTDNLGSILLVKEQPTASHNAKPLYGYLGHTDKQLNFKKPS